MMITKRMYLRFGIVLILVTYVSTISFALAITLHRSNDVKLDSTAKWMIVEKLESNTKCCNSNEVTGKIKKVSKDSITIAMERLQITFKDKMLMRVSDEKYISDEIPYYSIAKSDIIFIEKKYNHGFKKGINYIGGALLLTGIATGIHSLIVESEDRTALLASAGIQVGSSLLLFSFGKSKEKYVINDKAWHF